MTVPALMGGSAAMVGSAKEAASGSAPAGGAGGSTSSGGGGGGMSSGTSATGTCSWTGGRTSGSHESEPSSSSLSSVVGEVFDSSPEEESLSSEMSWSTLYIGGGATACASKFCMVEKHTQGSSLSGLPIAAVRHGPLSESAGGPGGGDPGGSTSGAEGPMSSSANRRLAKSVPAAFSSARSSKPSMGGLASAPANRKLDSSASATGSCTFTPFMIGSISPRCASP
mmetsp:Transcript_36868/g.85034  ORF Transcript_36868/g.85034 Transcript_36868/m.85034 type:complete len:226 (+) Transcript_36868:289-966(+)